MHSAAWIDLLKRIPPAQHDNLMLLTTIGTEITIQGILRLEEEYLVIRGRVAGTTDAGRFFFVPYSQINYLGFLRTVKEADVYALYGAPPPEPTAAKPAETEPSAQAPAEGPPATAPVEPVPSPPVEPPVPKDEKPSKTILLERLRARLASAVGKSAKS